MPGGAALFHIGRLSGDQTPSRQPFPGVVGGKRSGTLTDLYKLEPEGNPVRVAMPEIAEPYIENKTRLIGKRCAGESGDDNLV